MNDLVEKALEAITDRVNLSTGLTHPNDLNSTKELLVKLHQDNEILNGQEIASWAVAHGWNRSDARKLGDLAQRIGQGDNVRIEGKWWNDKIIDILRERSKRG